MVDTQEKRLKLPKVTENILVFQPFMAICEKKSPKVIK